MPEPDQMPEADRSPHAREDAPRIDDAMAEALLGSVQGVAEAPAVDPFAVGVPTAKMSAGAGGMWQPPSVEDAASLFPNYEVLALLGRGGMGAVYKARQIELDRLVAIKLLPLEISVDPDFADRFRREARAMAKLSHPNIITVHDFGTTSTGHLYFAMEFIEGANLHQIIHGPGMAPAQALAIIIGVCEALAYAHGKGVVHRDIKPANVMVSTDGQVKVADFGLARLTDTSAEQMGHTMTGTVMGTPDYMAPEQMRGMNVDHRADIYSLGVMLYEMLCKDVPRGFFDPPSLRAGVDARVDDVVKRAMQQQPERRYQQTGEMKADVAQIHTSMVAPTPSLVAAVQGGTRAPSASPASAAMSTRQSSKMRSERAGHRRLLPIVAVMLVAGVGAFVMMKRAKPGAEGSAASADFAQEKAPAKPVAASTPPLEPGAIKLWDSPAKVTVGNSATWENDALLVKRGLNYRDLPQRDAAIRAKVRALPDADTVQLALRVQFGADGSGSENYYINPIFSAGMVRLVHSGFGSTPAQSRELATWKLPRTYGKDEWPSFELRAVADELTVSVDGTKLGSVRDDRLMKPGGAVVFARNNGYFRDIVFVPLDKTRASSILPAKPTANGGPTTSSTAATATKDAPFVNSLGMKFVPVPGTKVLFSIWDTRVQDYEVFAHETQRNMGKTSFPQGPTHPVVYISWEDAQSFCQWLTARERADGRIGARDRYRLPTDHEWSYAVGIGDKEDERKPPLEKKGTFGENFPWGSQWPPPDKAGNYSSEDLREALVTTNYTNLRTFIPSYRDGYATTAPVGSFAANSFGLYDMGGNVWQWCEDWGDGEKKGRVRRGGSWNNGISAQLLSSHREQSLPSDRFDGFGFRCVLEPALSVAVVIPANATKDAPFVNSLGMKFVPVPILDGPTKGQRVLFSIWETRERDYEAFVSDTKREWSREGKAAPKGPDFPAIWVGREDAQAFCAWLTERERKAGRIGTSEGYRLPTDYEWGCAAGIGDRVDQKQPVNSRSKQVGTPWNAWPPPSGAGNFGGEELAATRSASSFIAGYRDDFVERAPVGSFAADSLGLFDLMGNVQEWVEDDLLPGEGILRGGSCYSPAAPALDRAWRYHTSPVRRADESGFRAVLAPVR